MAETITTLHAVPYVVPAASYNLTVTDDLGAGRTVVWNPSGTARTYRPFLAFTGGGTPGTNSGTEADPDEPLTHLQTQLNAGGTPRWTVTLSTAALVTIGYQGNTTASITFPADLTLRNLLGWTTSGTGSLVGGQAAVATYQPMMLCASIARERDTGWVRVPQKFGGAEMPDGSVVGWGDGQHRARRAYDLRYHPPGTMPAGMTGANPAGALATPLYPALSTALAAPTRSTAGLSAFQTMLPWSVWETFAVSAGVRIGLAPGNFQALRAGTDTLFDDVYLALETIQATDADQPSTAGFAGRWDYRGVRVWFRAQMTR